jgi:hypothetical protein
MTAASGAPVGEAAGVAGYRLRHGLLLLALFVVFVFEGIAQPGEVQRAIGTILVGVTLLLALYSADVDPRLLRIAGAVILVIVAGAVIASLADGGHTVAGLTAVASGLLLAFAPPAVVVGVARNLRVTGSVTVPVVAGALCLYLLLGLFFAFTYTAVQYLGGAPFFASGAAATSDRSVYFSFVTLTTVGYGDYTARTNLGHTLSMTEALVGQIYLVTVVATVVSRVVPRASAAGK